MNDITTIVQPVALALPDDIAFEAWVEVGRDLLGARRRTDWMLADWFDHGRRHFAAQEQFALMLDRMGLDTKEASAKARVAALIPESWRSDAVSFEVASQIAKVEDEEHRRSMLDRASREHWTSRKAHHAVVEHRTETGALFEDDDDETRIAVEGIRWWNRSPPEAREYFFALAEIAAGDGFAPIDEDEAR